jgi:hypothetical protein
MFRKNTDNFPENRLAQPMPTELRKRTGKTPFYPKVAKILFTRK